jgi:hypothetical protein
MHGLLMIKPEANNCITLQFGNNTLKVYADKNLIHVIFDDDLLQPEIKETGVTFSVIAKTQLADPCEPANCTNGSSA